MRFDLIDAQCRVEQAAAILSLMLDSIHDDEREMLLISGVLSLLAGVPEVIREAERGMIKRDKGASV
ncbi:hypothetical protein [Enterobacter kobei]|uniref:hypothetical protein n=1 Tax=Enterobacter kobei TaxID=208224 RepID=UPI003A976252